MKRLVLFLLSMVICASVYSQERARLSSQNYAGILAGASTADFQVQTVNGVAFKNWFTGIGVGIDYYSVRSIPLFIDIRKNLLKNTNKFFAYVDAGIHFPWLKERDYELIWIDRDFKNGFYGDAGLGYTYPLTKRSAILLSAGYSIKLFSEKRRTQGFCPGPVTVCPDQVDRFHYELRRISIKAGVTF